MTPFEFASKVDWEGGVIDALEYGLRAKDIDDTDPELKSAWGKLEKKWNEVRPLIYKMEEMLEDIEESS